MSPPTLSKQCAEIQAAIIRLKRLIAEYNAAPGTPDAGAVLDRKAGLKEAESELAFLEAQWNTECADPEPQPAPIVGYLYVANSLPAYTPPAQILVFPLNGSNNVAPARTISGEKTGLKIPVGMALDTAGNLYVANAIGSGPPGPQSITIYGPEADGNEAPMSNITIKGGSGITGPIYDIDVDPTGALWVASQADNAHDAKITAYAPFHLLPAVAELPAPAKMIAVPGPFVSLNAMKLDRNGNVVTATSTLSQALIFEFPPGANAQPLSWSTAPEDPNTIRRMAFDTANKLYLTFSGLGGSQIVVFALPLTENSVPQMITPTGGISPFGIAVDNTGKIYVSDVWKNLIAVFPPLDGANDVVDPLYTIQGARTTMTFPQTLLVQNPVFRKPTGPVPSVPRLP
jgi:hypothetical protein